jgi:flavin reductase (DIM6/NTAB) family NADH-FMN oxidoreductase RutF
VTRSAAEVDEFRALMAQFPTGVAIVTTMDTQGRPRGLTCSSMCSVTLCPPTLLVCLRDASPTLAALRERAGFAVNLLHDGARPVAELFASGLSNRFDAVHWEMPAGAYGPHLPLDTHAVADCRLSHTEPVGDHVVVFGETVNISRQPTFTPLLYGRREYRSWPGQGS